MSELSNVHCLGCKSRHEKVNVSEVKTIYVKGSPRYQGVGVCPAGKNWTKILNKQERTFLAHMMENTNTENVEKTIEITPQESTNTIDNSEKHLTEKNKSADSESEINQPDVTTDDIIALFEDTPAEQNDNPILTDVTVNTEILSTNENLQTNDPLQGSMKNIEVNKRVETFVEAKRSEIDNLRVDVRSLHKNQTRPQPQTTTHPNHESKNLNPPRISAEQSYKHGRHYGYNEASFSGEAYPNGLSFHFRQSRVDSRFFDAFSQGYIEGGERYLVGQTQHDSKPSVDMQEESPISPRTTAGLAAASIFGAWVASKIKRG